MEGDWISSELSLIPRIRLFQKEDHSMTIAVPFLHEVKTWSYTKWGMLPSLNELTLGCRITKGECKVNPIDLSGLNVNWMSWTDADTRAGMLAEPIIRRGSNTEIEFISPHVSLLVKINPNLRALPSRNGENGWFVLLFQLTFRLVATIPWKPWTVPPLTMRRFVLIDF